MKKLHDLSIKRKFAIVLLPLIVTIICFDFLHIRHDYFDFHDARRLNKAINIGIEINHLVHEIQKERSISVGFQANDGKVFQERLLNQRHKTDSLLTHVYSQLRAEEYSEFLINHYHDIQDMKIQMGRLNELRSQIDHHSLETSQIITYFSEINKAALYTVNQLINETRDKAAAQQVHAIIYFLEAKEHASTERALGTYLFSTKNRKNDVVTNLTSVIAAQKAYIEAFLTISNKPSVDFYNRTMQGTDIDEVSILRSKLFQTDQLSIDPSEWYRVVTSKINSMKRVEDFMLERMHTYTESMAEKSRNSFLTFLILDFLIGLITFTLVALIVMKLIKNVGVLERFTERFSAGQTRERVIVDTKDEIGQYATTFNVMLDTISKTQNELRKERQKALYMYENIYKKAEVVFENVEQGIFLLDKELRISNLYSRAVERIFANKMISNENFCTFMRPRIIQRDFEALEIFMKHIFNPDMDEEVLQQLNPIEEVKTFITTNGVVITKYLKVSFTRIARNGQIQNILVTITDVTESVMLQNQVEKTEQKKRKDTEYLLNILNIEPEVLLEFITDTRANLQDISGKYEQNKDNNLNGLLEYTFRIIHKIKGNALCLGIELISEKIHETEESIVNLMNQPVTAQQFLTILYELEELEEMLIEMQKMHQKVLEVYNKVQRKNDNPTNERLVETIKSGFASLRKFTRKKVELNLDVDDNVQLSEEYHRPIRDMLNQLIRNSISHGIEDSETRKENGKYEKGNITITLSKPDYDSLQISYEDDGKGLDPEEIRTHALSTGLIQARESTRLTDEEVINLIFSGDFSTTEKADQLSGRGQGMGVIKSIIEELNGNLRVDSVKDQYFRMTINLKISNVRKMEKVA